MKDITDHMNNVLPAHFKVAQVETGARCKSRKGITDPKQWATILRGIRHQFGKRFMEVNHAVCTDHCDFTVHVRPFPKPGKNVKCDCGHPIADHGNGNGNGGWCHDSSHPRAGRCGCTFFHPNIRWIQMTRKKLGMPPAKLR